MVTIVRSVLSSEEASMEIPAAIGKSFLRVDSCSSVEGCAAAFRRDLDAKRVEAGMSLSTPQMWDRAANTIQALLLLEFLCVTVRALF